MTVNRIDTVPGQWGWNDHASLIAFQAHTIMGNPDQIVDLGYTEIPFEIFWEHLRKLAVTTYR